VALALVTVLASSVSACLHVDTKRSVAHSTMVHMNLALVLIVGSGTASSYLVVHGLAKASVFMCTGIMIHGVHSQDSRMIHHSTATVLRIVHCTCMACLCGVGGSSVSMMKDAVLCSLIASTDDLALGVSYMIAVLVIAVVYCTSIASVSSTAWYVLGYGRSSVVIGALSMSSSVVSMMVLIGSLSMIVHVDSMHSDDSSDELLLLASSSLSDQCVGVCVLSAMTISMDSSIESTTRSSWIRSLWSRHYIDSCCVR
jgi:NADH:ubiquinone oxidoreductase subunit 5 (subunit L)/multisubunit Na+/H+ antiporter MnhA subunit